MSRQMIIVRILIWCSLIFIANMFVSQKYIPKKEESDSDKGK